MRRRVPKLAIRNRLVDGDDLDATAILSSSGTGSRSGSSTPSSRSSHRVRPASDRTLSDDALYSRRSTANQESGKRESKPQSNVLPTKKRKGAGMLGFLTLKEPSSSAWADLAQAEKQKAKQKSGLTLQSSAAGASLQKLPNYVPKVNSKWDGLPDSAKQRSFESKTSDGTNRSTLLSGGSRQSNWTSWTTNSLASPTSQAGKFRASLSSGRDSASSGSTKQPPALALIPDPNAVETTDENRPQTFLRPPSPPQQEQELLQDSTALLSPPELVGDDILHLHELDVRRSPTIDSPTTPPAEGTGARPALVGIHYPELDSTERPGSRPKSETSWYDDTNKEVVESSPVQPDPPNRAINFSRPRPKTQDMSIPQISKSPTEQTTRQSTEIDRVPMSPSLKDNNGRINPFLTDTFALHSRSTGHIPQRAASTLVKDPVPPTKDTSEDATAQEEVVSPISPIDANTKNLHLSPQSAEPELSSRPTSVVTAVYNPETAHVRSRSELSLAPSVTPSELSERWQMSPRERLGLGANVRKSEVLPWETTDIFQDNAEAGRSMKPPLSPPLTDRISRRLSWRLSTPRR